MDTLKISSKLKGIRVYSVWLLIAGFIGLYAAFALTMERFAQLETSAPAGCDYSLVIQCSANLESWQGSVFGFPNPLIGLMAWPLVIVTSILLILRVRLPKIYWVLFCLGTLSGFGFTAWLIFNSIYILGTLCLWCMWTWFAMIPTAIATIFVTLKALAPRKKIYKTLGAYSGVISIGIFALVALLAQIRLDWISYL